MTGPMVTRCRNYRSPPSPARIRRLFQPQMILRLFLFVDSRRFDFAYGSAQREGVRALESKFYSPDEFFPI